MSWRRLLSRLSTAVACGTLAAHAFAAEDTLEKSRPVTGREKPGLPNKTTALIRSDDARGTLRIRCIPNKGLDAEVDLKGSTLRIGPNAAIRIRYRADEGSVSEDKAWPAGGGGATLPNARQVLEDGSKASALHMEIVVAGGPSTALVFRPKDARLLAKLQSDCPDDAPPPDQNGLAR